MNTEIQRLFCKAVTGLLLGATLFASCANPSPETPPSPATSSPPVSYPSRSSTPTPTREPSPSTSQPTQQPSTSPAKPESSQTSSPTQPITRSVSPSSTSGVEAQVLRVIDGDTIEVSLSGRRYTVRYIGIDTPETVDPSRPVQPYGVEASNKNTELVSGKVVRLEKDVSETDRYGRLLRYVYVGNLFVNAELVRLGYAQVATYPPDVKYQSLFLQLQAEAREANRGLWGLSSTAPSQPSSSSSAPSFSPIASNYLNYLAGQA